MESEPIGGSGLFRGFDVSASGLMAERVRMGLIAANIAHATDTDRGDGNPYQRKLAVFETLLEGEMAGGVRIASIVDDTTSPHPEQFRPGHPHASKNGMLRMPNVNPTFEMIDLMTSSRSYEANMQAMQVAIRMAEQALELGR